MNSQFRLLLTFLFHFFPFLFEMFLIFYGLYYDKEGVKEILPYFLSVFVLYLVSSMVVMAYELYQIRKDDRNRRL